MSPTVELTALRDHCAEVFACAPETRSSHRLISDLYPESRDISRALASTGVHKAVPLGCAPSVLWKLAATSVGDLMHKALANLWSASSTGDMASDWKDADLALIPKPRKPATSPSNLRPLGLLTPPGKALAQ